MSQAFGELGKERYRRTDQLVEEQQAEKGSARRSGRLRREPAGRGEQRELRHGNKSES